MIPSFRRLAAVLAALALTPFAQAGAQAPERVVHVYNFTDYIAEEALKSFTAETGIRVVYDVYDKNEILETKLLAGKSGYDVVFPSLKPFAERMLAAKLFRALDKNKLHNLANLEPGMMRTLAAADAGNAHLVPYMWGTTGLGYNVAKIKAALGSSAPVNSWALLFEPKNASKLAACGISVLDDDEALAAALIYLRRDPNSARPEDLDAAAAAFRQVRPHIKHIHSSLYLDALANGDICLAHGYSGDVIQARNRAIEAKNNVEIAYAVPSEGAVLWVDVMAIPADAPHADAAHAFIDYLLRPEVIAAISNKVSYANANARATPLVDKDVREDPNVYLPDAAKERLVTLKVLDERERRLRTRAWTRIKTGQ
ncbi:MAG: polyamine ABC transporter substrate-binding protein [Pseudomonadota bacterium]